ncbi:unnamed protein product [Laminaria digitata]
MWVVFLFFWGFRVRGPAYFVLLGSACCALLAVPCLMYPACCALLAMPCLMYPACCALLAVPCLLCFSVVDSLESLESLTSDYHYYYCCGCVRANVFTHTCRQGYAVGPGRKRRSRSVNSSSGSSSPVFDGSLCFFLAFFPSPATLLIDLAAFGHMWSLLVAFGHFRSLFITFCRFRYNIASVPSLRCFYCSVDSRRALFPLL